jgi:hypothetical protein
MIDGIEKMLHVYEGKSEHTRTYATDRALKCTIYGVSVHMLSHATIS